MKTVRRVRKSWAPRAWKVSQSFIFSSFRFFLAPEFPPGLDKRVSRQLVIDRLKFGSWAGAGKNFCPRLSLIHVPTQDWGGFKASPQGWSGCLFETIKRSSLQPLKFPVSSLYLQRSGPKRQQGKAKHKIQTIMTASFDATPWHCPFLAPALPLSIQSC